VACLLAAFFGFLGGWSARVGTADHRYIRAMAERHERVAEYYLVQTDELIQQNKADIARERKTHK
jgi:hypothetical protein